MTKISKIKDVALSKEDIVDYLEWVMFELQNNFKREEDDNSMAKCKDAKKDTKKDSKKKSKKDKK